MSHVTEALKRAKWLRDNPAIFDQHDHPWTRPEAAAGERPTPRHEREAFAEVSRANSLDGEDVPTAAGRATDPRAADGRAADGRDGEARGLDPRSAEAQRLAAQSVSAPGPTSRAGETRLDAPRHPESPRHEPPGNVPLTPLHQQLVSIVERVFLPMASMRVGLISLGSETSASVAGPMADVLATHTSATVGVVDANFASPSLHSYFDVPNESGFVDANGEPRTHLAAVRVRNNLWVVPAGSGERPMLAGDATREATAHLLSSVDYAIVSLASTDVSRDVLLRMLNGVVLVIDAQRTRRQDGRRATSTLREAGIPILGALLVNRDYPVPNAIYRRL